jgi:hypothetical protein
MKIKELIAALELCDPEQEVMILDGFNGGGSPRTINFGPCLHLVDQKEADDAADCEDLVGQHVQVLGYGCY